MNPTIFRNIFRILERESKTTTYKFALLRGTIDIIQDSSPYIRVLNDRVTMPIGLLIEKWLVYYYPILESSTLIPQIGEGRKLNFAREFLAVIDAYRGIGGFSAFFNDLKHRGIPVELRTKVNALARKIRDTIKDQPMRYIGSSINAGAHYSIFRPEVPPSRVMSVVDAAFLIESFGTFSIPRDYYEAFRSFGSFITGQDALLFKWAEFSVNVSGKSLSIEKVINEVLRDPVTEREVRESKKVYESVLRGMGKVRCAWTGKPLVKYDIDHVIPFSVWKNNDLWNLLPVASAVNTHKRDRIPSPDLIQRQRNLIVDYWHTINAHHPDRFQKEVRITLLGNSNLAAWPTMAITQLQSTCEHLITTRGFEAWEGD